MYQKPNCEVCGRSLHENYCTANICRACCESGKCPNENNCYAKELERELTVKRKYMREKT